MSDQIPRKTYNVFSVTNYPIALMGRVTQDVELRYTPSGVPVVNINLVLSRKYRQNEEWQEEASFIRFSVWRDAAERAKETLHIGDVVEVLFHPSALQANAYAAQDGTPKASLQASATGFRKIASSVEFGLNNDYVPSTTDDQDIPF